MPAEAVMFWNEPNNLSHWDFEMDRGWREFSEMTRRAAMAIRRLCPRLPLVLGTEATADGVVDHDQALLVESCA